MPEGDLRDQPQEAAVDQRLDRVAKEHADPVAHAPQGDFGECGNDAGERECGL